jgi:hypothetical protein
MENGRFPTAILYPSHTHMPLAYTSLTTLIPGYEYEIYSISAEAHAIKVMYYKNVQIPLKY